MVPAGFENAGVPDSPPGVAIEDDEQNGHSPALTARGCVRFSNTTERFSTGPTATQTTQADHKKCKSRGRRDDQAVFW